MFMQMRSRRRNRPAGADETSRQTPFAKRGVKFVSEDGSVRIEASGDCTVEGIRVGDKHYHVAGGVVKDGPLDRPTFLDRPMGRLLVYAGIMAFCAACWAGCIYGVFR